MFQVALYHAHIGTIGTYELLAWDTLYLFSHKLQEKGEKWWLYYSLLPSY